MNGEVGFGSDEPAERDEIVEADIVGLDPVGPHGLWARRALVAIAGAVAPVVGRDEVAPGHLNILKPTSLKR